MRTMRDATGADWRDDAMSLCDWTGDTITVEWTGVPSLAIQHGDGYCEHLAGQVFCVNALDREQWVAVRDAIDRIIAGFDSEIGPTATTTEDH